MTTQKTNIEVILTSTQTKIIKIILDRISITQKDGMYAKEVLRLSFL
jgi:hypothetical protein